MSSSIRLLLSRQYLPVPAHHIRPLFHQQPCIRVLRVVEDMLKISLVHHAALIQHHDPVRYPGDGVQIVGDKYHGSLFFLLDPQKLVQDLILGDSVNGGGRLVRNQKDGFHSGGNSDHDPLEHSTGELVGILLQYLLRIADTHFFQQLKGASADLLPVTAVVGGKGLGDLGADTIERVETGHWILQYNAHLAAP